MTNIINYYVRKVEELEKKEKFGFNEKEDPIEIIEFFKEKFINEAILISYSKEDWIIKNWILKNSENKLFYL